MRECELSRRGCEEELRHFASRGVMNIEGLGESMVAQLLGHTLAEIAVVGESSAANDTEEEVDAVPTKTALVHSIADIYDSDKVNRTSC